MVKKKAEWRTIEISCVEVWREISNYVDEEISPEMRERNGSAFQGFALTALLYSTVPEMWWDWSGRKGVPNARWIQQAAIQKASETSLNLRSDG